MHRLKHTTESTSFVLMRLLVHKNLMPPTLYSLKLLTKVIVLFACSSLIGCKKISHMANSIGWALCVAHGRQKMALKVGRKLSESWLEGLEAV